MLTTLPSRLMLAKPSFIDAIPAKRVDGYEFIS